MAVRRSSVVVTLPFFLFCCFCSVSLSKQEQSHHNQNKSSSFSLSFPLQSHPLPHHKLHSLRPSLASAAVAVKSPFKFSMVPVVSIPIGTPPQTQDMILDTGSQLSWIQCHGKGKKAAAGGAAGQPPSPSTATFDPSLSSSFSVLPCNHPLCKPRTPDFTLPTSCDQNRLCHYSYFYADGTLAEGNLVREKFTFSTTQTTPPLILGCATSSGDDKGILGMNLGRLSFPSQAKVSKFSYCVPARASRFGPSPTGSLYLGDNPNSGAFQYIGLMTFGQSQRMPNLDPLAYTVAMQGIRIGTRRLSIPQTAFRPDASGSGQTMIDSGSEFTYLVDEAYDKVREEVVRLVGPRMKKGYVYGGVADMCFDGDAAAIGQSIGDVAFEFEKGVEIVVAKEKVLAEVDGGVHCMAVGRSSMLGAASNIIGNFHQQDLWVEFDPGNRRVGFGRADCSRS
ncbi:aspartic proteinase PCS1-like [Syzygium oleosum]|uniref:aspartic proteinase PCS1-like n=1 Tax=Syzygium oleosum TaxID=219896 RepID=UPI0011D1E9B0|nr:aspartic proteinase PCS1-like [Syzygium oleosum]